MYEYAGLRARYWLEGVYIDYVMRGHDIAVTVTDCVLAMEGGEARISSMHEEVNCIWRT
jgi:hypothetical protein